MNTSFADMPLFCHTESLKCQFILIALAWAASSTVNAGLIRPVSLSDTTTEVVQTGYTQDPTIENLEFWFDTNGITRPDGSAIDVVQDQAQYELFYVESDGTLEIQYLGAGYAAYHSPFGLFTYSGDPYRNFDSGYMDYQAPLFIQNEVDDGAKFLFDVFADTYLGLYLNVNGSNTLISSLNASNPGGGDNFLAFETNAGFTFAIEDIPFGGDRDYEDLIVNLNSAPSRTAAIPSPSTIALISLGLIGLARMRRKP